MSAPSNPTIVYVHGIGNKRKPETLRREWDRALFGREMGGASRMAYWADLRYGEPLPDRANDELPISETELEAVGREETPAVVQSTEDFVEQTSEELVPEGDPAAESLRRLAREMAWRADALAAGEEDREARLGEEILPLPRGWRTWLFRQVIQRFLADAHAYVSGGQGASIRSRLEQALQGLTGPVVVVGHSLGSVIAYDVLHEYQGALDVPLFVTVGSPLATREIQDVVAQPLQVPRPVTAWLNAADGRDLVAVDPTIRPEYAPVERCSDYLVVNDADPHHHGISGYLAASPIQGAIRRLFGIV